MLSVDISSRNLLDHARGAGALWEYDYHALSEGRPGMHAILKSGLHSDGFFASKILLAKRNVLEVVAREMVTLFQRLGIPNPQYVAGVPTSASTLGVEVARLLRAKALSMAKIRGKIKIIGHLPPQSSVLVVEDVCTRGTGFGEAVEEIFNGQPAARFILVSPVILNRGGLTSVDVPTVGDFSLLPLVEKKMTDWNPEEFCYLCSVGSKPIKPKDPPENWKILVESQRP
jgi:hypothetical protein